MHCSAGFIQGCEGHPRNPISCKSTTDITTSTTTSTYGICVYMCYPTSWLHSWVRRTPTESAQRSNQLKNWITQHATLGEEDFKLQAFAASDASPLSFISAVFSFPTLSFNFMSIFIFSPLKTKQKIIPALFIFHNYLCKYVLYIYVYAM